MSRSATLLNLGWVMAVQDVASYKDLGDVCLCYITLRKHEMKQLDVVVSPPAFLWDPYLTFDPNPHDL